MLINVTAQLKRFVHFCLAPSDCQSLGSLRAFRESPTRDETRRDVTRRRRRRRRRRAPRWLRRNRKTRDSARRSARPVRAARAWGARASSRAQTATRRRVSSSSSGTRAERTDTREQPPREQRIAGLVGRLHRVVDDIGVFNDELETDFKESEFGALAVVARAMPKKPVESPTSYEDIFERIKFPGYVVRKTSPKRAHPGGDQRRTRSRSKMLRRELARQPTKSSTDSLEPSSNTSRHSLTRYRHRRNDEIETSSLKCTA